MLRSYSLLENPLNGAEDDPNIYGISFTTLTQDVTRAIAANKFDVNCTHVCRTGAQFLHILNGIFFPVDFVPVNRMYGVSRSSNCQFVVSRELCLRLLICLIKLRSTNYSNCKNNDAFLANHCQQSGGTFLTRNSIWVYANENCNVLKTFEVNVTQRSFVSSQQYRFSIPKVFQNLYSIRLTGTSPSLVGGILDRVCSLHYSLLAVIVV